MKEIVLHGRGGQGVVFAADLLVNAFVLEGKFGNAIPFFGFERRGAPVAAFVRVDDRPIREKTQIYHPDCVIVLDPTLSRTVDIFKGLRQNAIVVLNDPRRLDAISFPAQVRRAGAVNATHIALAVLQVPIPNSCMIGAFVKSTGWVSWQGVEESFRANFPPHLVEANLKAAREAYELTEVKDFRGEG